MGHVRIKSLSLSELQGLSEKQFTDRVHSAAKSRFASLNGEQDELLQRITAFEKRYEMSSETMCQRYADSRLEETEDICTWQMLLTLRDHIANATA